VALTPEQQSTRARLAAFAMWARHDPEQASSSVYVRVEVSGLAGVVANLGGAIPSFTLRTRPGTAVFEGLKVSTTGTDIPGQKVPVEEALAS
jgi:hypothetical protein